LRCGKLIFGYYNEKHREVIINDEKSTNLRSDIRGEVDGISLALASGD
jgi:hypothetical protein